MLSKKNFNLILISGIFYVALISCKNNVNHSEPTPTVYIESTGNGYQLIRNNEPFPIRGGSTNPQFLEELKQAGANTARIYDTLDLHKTLDKAKELGLAVVVDIPLPHYEDTESFEDEQLFTEMKKRVRRVVKKHKDHPALLYWNLGNEVHYPGFYRRLDFFSNFESLVDLIRQIDPNHPISTTVAGGNRKRMTSIALRGPGLDLISINIFGALPRLHERPEFDRFLWEGPFVISEWGYSGPWEVQNTAWGAPLENTSNAKAEIIRERFGSEVMQNEACLGNMIFYWGHKQESTPTWFSIFSEDGGKSSAFYTMHNLWSDDTLTYNGPHIEEIQLNNQRGMDNIILNPNEPAGAEIFLQDSGLDSLEFAWEIRKEAWAKMYEEQPIIEGLIQEQSLLKVAFNTPEREGPYRLLVYIKAPNGDFATANVPFYILNAAHGEQD